MPLRFDRPYSPSTKLADPDSPEDLQCFREVLRSIETLAAQGESLEELHRFLKIAHCGGTFVTPSFDPGLTIFRAVSIDSKPLNKSRISYPPVHLVKQNGRLNAIGETLFYGSIGQAANTLYECRANVGDLFAIGRWTTTRTLLLNHLGYSNSDINSRLPPARSLQYWMMPDHPNSRNGVLRAWQSEVFTRNVAPGEEPLYHLSIALARLAMDKIKNSPPALPELGGVLYPSVSAKLLGDNVALRPSTVDSSLELSEVMLVRVRAIPPIDQIDAEGKLNIVLDTIDTAQSHRSDGRLVWLGENTALSVTLWN